MPECPNCGAFDPEYTRPFECDSCGMFCPVLDMRDEANDE